MGADCHYGPQQFLLCLEIEADVTIFILSHELCAEIRSANRIHEGFAVVEGGSDVFGPLLS